MQPLPVMPGRVRIWGGMIKFSHSVFALPFALIATFLAGRSLPGGLPYAGQVVLIVLCMVFARSVAMTFNRLVDAALDAANPRTAGRALPAGLITRRTSWFFVCVCAGGFVLTCAGFWWFYDNPWPLWLSGPLLTVLCGYSYTKRFTSWSHVALGVADGLSPLAAWVAIDPGSLGWPAVILGVIVALWIGGFDIIYACQDVAFDRRVGLFSLPAAWGVGRALWVTRAAHMLTVVLLLVLAPVAGLGWLYVGGVVVVAALLLVENLLVGPGDLSRVNVAFFTVNGLVSVLLGLVAVGDVCLQVMG
ncbi:MAG TPA: UbiA-like polyprenyltransferase [Phycisphaerae bacterium]|nr:UbiA-like polyprenyltransferase [Phycisphaerae bacterium]